MMIKGAVIKVLPARKVGAKKKRKEEVWRKQGLYTNKREAKSFFCGALGEKRSLDDFDWLLLIQKAVWDVGVRKKVPDEHYKTLSMDDGSRMDDSLPPYFYSPPPFIFVEI